MMPERITEFIIFCFKLGLRPCGDFQERIMSKKDFWEIELKGTCYDYEVTPFILDAITHKFNIKVVTSKHPYKFRYYGFNVKINFEVIDLSKSELEMLALYVN